jgi:hypothetical protein
VNILEPMSDFEFKAVGIASEVEPAFKQRIMIYHAICILANIM